MLRVIAELGLVGAWGNGGGGVKDKGKGELSGPQQVHKVLQGLVSERNLTFSEGCWSDVTNPDALQLQMTNDPQYNNIPLLITFLKSYKRPYLGPSLAEGPIVGSSDELVPVDVQSDFTKLFEAYFDKASKALVKGHSRLLEQGKRNHEAYIKSGEIFEDRQNAYERMAKAVEKLSNGVQSLADLLDLKPPELASAASGGKISLQIVDGSSAFGGRNGEDVDIIGGIWEDEEERKFYEDLLDLADEVPPAILGNATAKKEETSGEGGASLERVLSNVSAKSNGNGVVNEIGVDADENPAEAALMDKGVETADLQAGPAARLNAIFAALPEANNRNLIDKLAVDFAFLNSKGARKRCYKFLAGVPRNRTDLLPYYSRFAATLNRYMPDIGSGLISILDEEFKYLQRKKQVKELESVRIKNVRFLGELVKFKVAQTHTIFHAFKVLLDDFVGPNVDMMAMLLETCGRYLLRTEDADTSERMKSVLEIMRRKQSAQHFDSRQQLLLDNAYYQCNPPERAAREQIVPTPIEAFIQHLIHDVLFKKTIDKVLKLLRKMHWEDEKVYDYLYKTFTEIWEVKFGSIPLLAMLVYDLQKYHPEFAVSVVDQVLENVRAGMEENIFKYNQRRIATIKYLGELYMYRVLNTPVIFDTLWSLTSFGHPEGLPVPGRSSPIDASDDFFRVRLICTLLDTCGACFDRGSSKRKLDQFLVVFQMYILCKDEMPMDVEFMVSDTFEVLRPKTARLKTIEEAAAAIDEMFASQGTNSDAAEEESDDEDGPERGGRDDEEDVEMDDAAREARIDDDGDDDENDGDGNSSDEEDVRIIGEIAQRDAAYDQEAEDDFNREFARMLADTTDVRKHERKVAAPVFDTALPVLRRAGGTPRPTEDDVPHLNEEPAKHMQFSLLSKKGNKQQIRTLEVPIESALAQNTRSHQLQNKQEQEQLKRLVLQNERRQEENERATLAQNLSRSMFARPARGRDG